MLAGETINSGSSENANKSSIRIAFIFNQLKLKKRRRRKEFRSKPRMDLSSKADNEITVQGGVEA